MAKCTVIEVKPVPPPKEYVLLLNEEEAGLLISILGASSNSTQCPPMYAIYSALVDAKVKYRSTTGRIVY